MPWLCYVNRPNNTLLDSNKRLKKDSYRKCVSPFLMRNILNMETRTLDFYFNMEQPSIFLWAVFTLRKRQDYLLNWSIKGAEETNLGASEVENPFKESICCI